MCNLEMYKGNKEEVFRIGKMVDSFSKILKKNFWYKRKPHTPGHELNIKEALKKLSN